ncbi:MAG: beta-ketoacyl synthase N-terminal-like domain-containing protein [Proteobacteria bacterium]|nr:beta-ketoacyl synthase N-terminal-like domain-containing protein [Pseudomonadota bacterium]
MNNQQSIAIVGIGGVFPGARDLDEFWQNILEARDTAIDVGADRWRLDPDDLYSADLSPDKVNSRRACLIQDFEFNPVGFNVKPDLLRRLDPLYQILLHAGRDAWADAKTDSINKERVGVIIGNIVLPTESSSRFSDEIFKPLFEAQLFDKPEKQVETTESLNRYVAGLPGGLLAKALGLGAGACTLDAACSSSLYSLKYAVDELLAGRSDAILAGGVSRPDCLYTQMGFSQLNAISKSGRCSPFDSKADGLVVGEGAGIFVLKRLQDAISHDDHIYATIEGIGLSNDIEGNIMSPDSEGQCRAMQSAYTQAGWLPNQVQHIECHGTGTPVGDGVEFTSLNNLWQSHKVDGECVIGSVKSNVGHLLTAAGAAALMKTLLAMKHGILPPTANYEKPSNKIDIANSPFKVLEKAESWIVEDNTPRRAAISGFGFGGINAHVLLQEFRNETKEISHVVSINSKQQDIAIVGMESRLGPWNDQQAFDQVVLFGPDKQTTQPNNWWGAEGKDQKGFLINEVRIPLGRYRIPPAELKEMLPQQLLMLEVAANALQDAGLSELTPEQQCRTGTFIGIALDLNTTNFHFRWMQKKYACKWLQGLGIELDGAELNEWISNLRAACGPALSANRTMGALGGIVASRIARAFRIGGPAFTISSEETSGLRALETGVRALQQFELDQVIVGAVDLASDLRAVKGHVDKRHLELVADGATVFVLKRHEDAIRDGNKVYALIKGIGVASAAGSDDDTALDNSAQLTAIQNACSDAQCHLESIDHVTFSAGDEVVESIPALQHATLNTFLLGHSGAANGLINVASAVSALHNRLLPGQMVSDNKNSQARYWLKDRIKGPRCSLVNSTSIDGCAVSVVLEEGDANTEARGGKSRLFLLSANETQSLIHKIQTLSFNDVLVQDQQNEKYRVSILVKDNDEFSAACEEAIDAIENNNSIDNGRCYYSSEPLYIDDHNETREKRARVAFVYPGSGNHFFGMGQELGVAFPNVLEKLGAENETLASQFANGRFWQDQNNENNHGKELSHEELIFGQVWLGTFVSDVIASFGIKPDAVIGYSLGETAGFFSTRTWTARDEMLQRIQQSTLFTEELAGPCRSVQKAWGTDNSIDWALGVINTSADKVKSVVDKYEHVYLLIVNTPDECVIGGDRTALSDAVKELAAQYHRLSGVTTVHSEVAKPVEKAYRDLHIFETTPPEGITFYSGIRGSAYEVTQDSAADSILDQALAPFDYTKVINSAYADGVRLFIEMGPGGSCTRMIDKILEDKPHYARAICVKGQDSVDNVMQILARLYAEGVPVDLSALESSKVDEKKEYKNNIIVKTGGAPFKVPLPPKTKPNVVSLKSNNESITEVSELNQQIEPLPMADFPRAINNGLQPIIQQMQQTELARAEAQETFLRISQGMTDTLSQAINMQMQLLSDSNVELPQVSIAPEKQAAEKKVNCKFNRNECLEFAIGSIGKVLGSAFADIDQYSTRVRLPDEPLMLVDRILELEGEPNSMTQGLIGKGRVVTEHDVLPGAWYLDMDRLPTCIAVEAGQADLFLSGYLGIDHISKGLAVYRLLDARITFHGPLPVVGQTIHYDIRIDEFFRQGDTWLFRFNFEGSVAYRDVGGTTPRMGEVELSPEQKSRVESGTETENGKPLLTMTHGCAGFFTQQELDAGQGIVLTNIEKQQEQGKVTEDWKQLVAMQAESYNDEQLNALRKGDLVGCFGDAFSNLGLNHAVGLPSGRMTLVHRILTLDPKAGRFGIGQITGEADIHPDDWFLICHFVDDKVMPGTLMYECCLHTLRIYLLRMGWVGETDEFVYEPIIGEVSQLKCRGQVIETTKTVQYEITLKEIGYKEDGTPYVLADALMYADHRAVVQMKNMSVQLSGLKRERLDVLWDNRHTDKTKQVLFDSDSILAFAIGKPSAAFGDRYKIFDNERKIARLPGPPYQFLDRITSIKNCEQWVLKAGGTVETEYDVPADEWYFTEDNQPIMPFAVLLEIALQPCGWLAAYLGSALSNDIDLSFRNLGGKATQTITVTAEIGTLTTKVKITNVSQSGGMIIQNFDYEMQSVHGLVYKGDTYFGFFSKQALADQVGIREAEPYSPAESERFRGRSFIYPTHAPMPADMMRMVDEISLYDPEGGPNGLGFIEGTARVKQEAWFFKAHFYQDPVWPGSLGLESFMQLLKIFAWERWQQDLEIGNFFFESMALNQVHHWLYRGQILPADDKVTIQAVITEIGDQIRTIKADGFLIVDGRIIYQMKDFTLRIT